MADWLRGWQAEFRRLGAQKESCLKTPSLASEISGGPHPLAG